MMITKCLEDLVGAGMTEAQIAAAIGRNQSSVNRMRNGKQRPDYETGTKIAELHRERCARPVSPEPPEQGRVAA